MFGNYFKTAWRNLLKNKYYSIINVAGLSLGLAIGILILLWVENETSYDGFHKKASRIYRLEIEGGTGTSKQIFTLGVAPIGPLAKKEIPEVEDQVRLTGNYNFSLYSYKDKFFGDEAAAFADPGFFSMFDFPLIRGNGLRPFKDDHSVVITQKTAKKFFGTGDPIGKLIMADNNQPLEVSGVIADFPKNSSFRPDMIMPMSFHLKDMQVHGADMDNNFSILNYETYLQLKPGASLSALSEKILHIHLSHKPDDTDASYLLLPLQKMHLYNADLTDKGIGTVRIFILIAVLILVIACINYVNLATARSMLRSKEISIRKITGAGRLQLFLQFMLETALLFCLSAAIALGLVRMLMPVFNQVSGRELVFDLSNSRVWLVLLSAIGGSLAASSVYPALLLSSFNPLKALKGKISLGIGEVLLRRILVVVQFAFSVMLIAGTLVITRQLNYIRTKDLGYDKSHTLSFWMRDMNIHYDAARAELLKQPGVQEVTRSNQDIIRFTGFTGAVDWDGKDPKQNLIIHPIAVDKDLISFFRMKLIQGSSFTGALTDSAHFILNEAAVVEMGIRDPVGKRFKMGEINGTIIGVVQDFHYTSMREKIAPAIFWYSPKNLDRMYIKVSAGNEQKTIAAAGAQFAKYNSAYPFSYAFLDDSFDNLYKSETQEGILFAYFAGIAIFISCLGLLGLAAYTAQVRIREIGIRKVLGAGIGNITAMLSIHFIKLVLIAIWIATPIAWYAMHKWLEGFAYRTNLNVWIFILTGLLALLIAFATLSYQAIRAALINPAKILRTE
jgi:putative ABC transport system permease protein